MNHVCLLLVDGLEVIEPSLCSRKAEFCRELHEAKLSIYVVQFFGIRKLVPVNLLDAFDSSSWLILVPWFSL